MERLFKQCPHCAKGVAVDALKCMHCGLKIPSKAEQIGSLVGGLFAFAFVVGFIWLFIGWQMGSFDDPPPPPPKIPVGGVKYEGQIYSAWEHSRHTGITRALERNGAYCPEYKYRESLSYHSEYIVYCLMDYESRKIPVSAYVVFPNVGEVVGPASTDSRLK